MNQSFNKEEIYICHSNEISSHSLYGIILHQDENSICLKTFSNYGRTEYPERVLSIESFQKYYNHVSEEDLEKVKIGTKLRTFCDQFYGKEEDLEME